MPVESSVHGAQAPGPGEFWPKSRLQARSPSSQQWTVLRHPILESFGPELTVEAIIDAGPGGILARIQSKFTMPVESSVHGAQAPGPGEFWPKSRLQARSPSSQQWTVLRHPILVSFGPELTVEAIIDAGPGDFGQNPVQIHDARRDECPRCSGTWPWGVLSQNQATGTESV